MNLTEEETHEAQCLINSKICGIYEIKDIYGSQWKKVGGNTFGKNFKASVDNNFLKNIRTAGKKSNNHWVYEIFFEGNA